MQVLPLLLPYQRIIYHTNHSKGRLLAIIRNEQAVLRQQAFKYPLSIELKDNSEFIIQEKFSTGGKGLTKFDCILRTMDDGGTELEARIIPHPILKVAFHVWTSFLLLAIASAIASVVLGFFYNENMLVFLWTIIPSGAMIFFIAMGVRRVLNLQIRRYKRVIEAMLQPYDITYRQ
ncbi:MAG: hypothetical protein ACPGJS_13760 [Flammeovirgaceae bacterium]